MLPLQKPLSRQISLALLVLIGLGIGLAGPVRALEISCNAGGCSIAEADVRLRDSSPNLLLSGSYTVFSRNPVGFSASVVSDLLQAAGTNGGCLSAQGRSLCVSPSTGSNRLQLFGVRVHLGSGAQTDDWRFGVRRIAPSPVVSHPGGITNPIPEPSAALVFGVGTLVAGGVLRRRV